MKSKFTLRQVRLAAIIVLISATSTNAQNLQHDWTAVGSGAFKNLQNMTVLENGDRYVAEDTHDEPGSGSFSVAKYNDDGDLVWQTAYLPEYEGTYTEPVATAYNAGAIFVLANVEGAEVKVVKFSGDNGLQLDDVWHGGGVIYRGRGIVADPVGTGVIMTGMMRYTDPHPVSGERQHSMYTIKYDADLNQVWPERIYQSLGLLAHPQNPMPTSRAITADSDGNVYVTGLLDVEPGPTMPPYRTSAGSAFTLKYNSLGVLEWIGESLAEPSITNFGYDNDFDATGTYMVYQSVPTHLVDEPASTGMTVLTKRNLDGSAWPPQRRPSRIRDLEVPDYGGTIVYRDVLAVDKTTSSAYIAYDDVLASSVALEKYNAEGHMLWRESISVGDLTLVQSVVIDKSGNVVVGVNNGIDGTQYSIFVYTSGGHFIDDIAVGGKVLKQLKVDNHNHIHAIGAISGSTSSYFVSRFSYEGSGHSSIPELLRPFDGFGADFFAHDRGDCWTGIDVSWRCFRPPYCINPDMNALLSLQGKTMWESSFSQPINTFLPQSKEFRTFSLRIADGQSYKQVLQLDDQLVKNGVKKLSFKTNSVDQSVDLNLETDGTQFPVTVSILNGAGKVMWTEQFMAPFQKQLSNKFKEPVAFISIDGPDDVGSLTYYPNPSSGAFTVMLDQVSLPAEIAIYDMQGFRIHRQMVKVSKAPINLSGQKPGLYVLRVKNGSNEIRELIQIQQK